MGQIRDCSNKGGIIRSSLDVVFQLFFLFLHAFLLLGQDHPVVLVVVLVPVSLEQLLEHRPHRRVVRALIETQVSGLTQILRELDWVSLAEDFDRSSQLLLLDAFVLVLLVVGLESLPGQHSAQEVHGHITDALHIVSAG